MSQAAEESEKVEKYIALTQKIVDATKITGEAEREFVKLREQWVRDPSTENREAAEEALNAWHSSKQTEINAQHTYWLEVLRSE